MATASHEHVALHVTFASKDVLFAWRALDVASPRKSWSTFQEARLVTHFSFPTAVADTFAAETVTPSLATAVDKHVALLLAYAGKHVLGAKRAFWESRKNGRTFRDDEIATAKSCPSIIAVTFGCQPVAAAMPAAIHKHVTLDFALVGEDIFCASQAICSFAGEARRTGIC
jgi:hypothetical protein